MNDINLIDASDYSEYVDVVCKAKKAGIECVLVYKPNVQSSQGESESPDVVACTSNDPKIIAALLGNYHVGCDGTKVNDDDEYNDNDE